MTMVNSGLKGLRDVVINNNKKKVSTNLQINNSFINRQKEKIKEKCNVKPHE